MKDFIKLILENWDMVGSAIKSIKDHKKYLALSEIKILFVIIVVNIFIFFNILSKDSLYGAVIIKVKNVYSLIQNTSIYNIVALIAIDIFAVFVIMSFKRKIKKLKEEEKKRKKDERLKKFYEKIKP